jgi:hypothetical protein
MKNTEGGAIQRRAENLHRNNAAEWILFALLWPAWLALNVWDKVRRFVPFVTSWFNSSPRK